MQLEIPRRKSIYYRNVGLSSVAVIVLGMISYNDWQAGNLLSFWGILMLGFFFINIVVVYKGVTEILKSNPALILSEAGIVDNISPARLPLIKWQEITHCELKRYRGATQLLISLTDNQRAVIYASRLNEQLILQTIKETGAAIIINCDTLNYNRELLLDAILNKIGKPRIEQHLITS